MKFATILFAVAVVSLTEGKYARYRRDVEKLQRYHVTYDHPRQLFNPEKFEEFYFAPPEQHPRGLASSPYGNSPPSPSLATETTTVSGPTTTTAATLAARYLNPLAGTPAAPTIPNPYDGDVASPKPARVNQDSTEAALKLPSSSKLPDDISDTSSATEVSIPADETPSPIAQGHEAITPSSAVPSAPLTSNLVIPDENSGLKRTLLGLGFPYGASLPSKVISLQPGVQTVLSYGSQPLAIREYSLPASQTPYAHAFPVSSVPYAAQIPYVAPTHTATLNNYVSTSNQAVNFDTNNNVPLFVQQTTPLIDIGQGIAFGQNQIQGLNHVEGQSQVQSFDQIQGLNQFQGFNQVQGLNQFQGLNQVQGLNHIRSLNQVQVPNQVLSFGQFQGNGQVQGIGHLQTFGQGFNQGPSYASSPQGLPVNLGGYGGIDYSGQQQSLPVVQPVLGITKLGHTFPTNTGIISKIGFGPGSW